MTAIKVLELLDNLEARGIRVEPVPGEDALIVQPMVLLSDADRQAIISNRKLVLELTRARDACRAADADVTGALLDRLKCYALPTGRMPVARELAAILRTIADANLQTIRSVLEAFECELIFRGGSFEPVLDASLPEGAN